MKVVMINDCAYVGETLLKYMPHDIEKQHIKRTRGLWNKTFGLTYKILKAKGDVYHAHYLLQDCYIASRLRKKSLIGHAHGSDLRISLKHPLWRRIVKHNLIKCDRILVSTPDVLGIAKKIREDAENFSNPVDTEIFYPKHTAQNSGKKKVLIASDSNWNVKGTDIAIRALSKIKDEVEINIIKYGVDFEKTLSLASSLGLEMNILPKVPHERLNQYYWDADAVIDRFKLGSLGVVSLEAIACGRPVITYVSSEYQEYEDFPLKDLKDEDAIADAIKNSSLKLWQEEHTYLINNHDCNLLAKKLVKIYEEVST